MKICTGDDGDGYQHLQRNVRLYSDMIYSHILWPRATKSSTITVQVSVSVIQVLVLSFQYQYQCRRSENQYKFQYLLGGVREDVRDTYTAVAPWVK